MRILENTAFVLFGHIYASPSFFTFWFFSGYSLVLVDVWWFSFYTFCPTKLFSHNTSWIFMSPLPLHFRRKSPNIRRDRLEEWVGHSGVLLANLRNIWAFAPQFMGPDYSGKILNAREEGPGSKRSSWIWMPWRLSILESTCQSKSSTTICWTKIFPPKSLTGP